MREVKVAVEADRSRTLPAEILIFGATIISTKEFQALKKIRHHDGSLADHILAVTIVSLRLAKMFGARRLDELIHGALLHDFFFYNWRLARPRSGGLHGFDHPDEALRNAEDRFGPLSAVERDCILRHMWPLTIIPPKYPESLIVCLADKIVSVREMYASLLAGKGLGFI